MIKLSYISNTPEVWSALALLSKVGDTKVHIRIDKCEIISEDK